MEVRLLLETLLRHERARESSVPGEIVVVDGSPDNRVEESVLSVANAELPFDLLYVKAPPGLTRQRNVGIDASSGNMVFFLDDDALPDRDYFQIVLKVFAADKAQEIGAIGGCVTNEWDLPLTWRWRARLALRLVPHIEPMRYGLCGTSNPRGLLKPYSGIREVEILSGCAFSFRREVFHHDRFSLFFDGYSQGEDTEMSLRVGRRWKVVCAGDARVVHNNSAVGRPRVFQKGRMEVRNRLFIWRRYAKARAGTVDRLRLYADFAFMVTLDLIGFLIRPWRLARLKHGLGIGYAFFECLLKPPDFDESASWTTYQVDFAGPETKELVRGS